jgi:predicted RNA binding protein YcfA (HicA-like mRNA interferase family)
VPRLPRVTGKDVVSALLKSGFEIFDQEGSHVYLHKRIGDTFGSRITVPMHSGKILKPKTLKSILKVSGITIDNFIPLLKK